MKKRFAFFFVGLLLLSIESVSQVIEKNNWGEVKKIVFKKNELPPNLCSKFTGEYVESCLQYCLPKNYSKEKKYSLVVYVPGYHGKKGGNIKNAIDIADNRECIVASLPLFKTKVNHSEIGKGVIIGFSDYPVLAKSYKIMFEKLFQIVPNIDSKKSAMAGFSNGALAIAVLVSCNDQYILNKFNSFCFVDYGMFHLADLYKEPAKSRRFLLLVGDKKDFGREFKISGAKLIQESYSSIGCDIESIILKNTGHELTISCKKEIGNWIFNDKNKVKE